MRATVRTLGIAKDTVTDALRSIEALVWYVNYEYLHSHQNGDITVECVLVNEVETDEMWSFVGNKSHMRLLRDEKPVKCREPFSFRIGTKFRKMMYVFKQFRNGDCLEKYILYYDQHNHCSFHNDHAL